MSERAGEKPVHEACDQCGSLMDVTGFEPFDAVICPDCSTETHVKRHFGTYRLERLHAIGGMSKIFIGWDTTLDRKVAIKVLNEQFCHDERRIEAFENEARLTAQVNHPNVIKVYGVGRAYERFYLVMELLKGENFEQVIKTRGALPEDEVLEIGVQVASGLRAAKSAGMIHRDVKPGNIIIDRSGHARLLDFGLALITQDGRVQSEEVWATPYYVPPEALERGIEDFRSDLYAFGACLYHALYGRPPFEATSTSNKILRRAKQTIPRLCQAAPWVSPATGEVVDRLMAFRPEDRWASYADVLKGLERARKTAGQGQPVPVHSRNRLERRKRQSHFGVTFLVLLLVLCGGLAFWKPWEKTKDIPPLPPAVDLPDVEEVSFNPGGTPDAELYDSWKSARGLVRRGNYQEATAAFLTLSRQPTLSGMSQVWATFEASIASSLAGRPGQARKLASRSLADLEKLTRQRSLQRRFRHLVEALQKIPPPQEDEFPENPDGIAGWMGTLALALKQWDQGQWEAALPAFARVRGAILPEALEWFQIYQEIADDYLADGLVLGRMEQLPAPGDAADAGLLITQLADAAGELRTRGRAAFNLEARQDHLARLRQSLAQSPPQLSSADWDTFQGTLRQAGKSRRFDRLSSLLASPPSDAPPEALWAWRYLLDKSTAFARDLGSMKNWTALTSEGRKIKPVSGNLRGLRLADGSFVPWQDLQADSLLQQHRGNRIHAAAFAWLAGLTEEAEQIAEEVASGDPDFRRDWQRVILGITG